MTRRSPGLSSSLLIVRTATNEETTPLRRRVDLGMDELAARTSADTRAQAPIGIPVRRIARARITTPPASDVAHVRWTNPYRASDEANCGVEQRAATQHLDGLPWYRAPLPEPEHACWRQSWQTEAGRLWLERCPCGGARTHHQFTSDPVWFGRNSRATGRVLSPSVIRRALLRLLHKKGRPA